MSPMSLHPSFQLFCFLCAWYLKKSAALAVLLHESLLHPQHRRLCALALFLCCACWLSLLSFASLMRLFLEFCSPGDMIISSLVTWLEFSEKSFQCFVFNMPVFKSAPVLNIFSLLWQNHSEYWREGGKIYLRLEFQSLTLGPNTICLL